MGSDAITRLGKLKKKFCDGLIMAAMGSGREELKRIWESKGILTEEILKGILE